MTMMFRSLILATAIGVTGVGAAVAQDTATQKVLDVLTAPALRANVTVSGDVVRIGDVVDNAGAASQIAIYRAPDLGTTGSLRTSQVLEALRSHQVIGVDTRNLTEISVTRSARIVTTSDIEMQVARALERRGNLGDAANLAVTFDRDLREIALDPANVGAMKPVAVRLDTRSGRFDITFEIANDAAPTRLRFTGVAIETVETTTLTRNVERNEILRASDLVIERRPKTEVGNDAVSRDRATGMQARKAMRAGQVLKLADLAKTELVTREQNITLVYEVPGIYLTGRGKALDNGGEGDTISVLNTQSKRTVQAVVTGPGQAAIVVVSSRPAAIAAAAPSDTETAPRDSNNTKPVLGSFEPKDASTVPTTVKIAASSNAE
jgi:flagella basal body P-ring formation protein FlgA